MLRKCHTARSGAFSLVELLVVIAVIGFLAAIAVATISSIRESAESTKTQRNAQTIASLYSSAVGAGMRTNDITSLPNAVSIVTDGTNVSSGSATYSFRLDGMSPEEIQKAQNRLMFTNGLLTVLPES